MARNETNRLAVMASIRPRYCCDIITGEKLVEVRKRAPKLKAPFKVYIYCTKKTSLPIGGKVIAEFICDKIDIYQYNKDGYGIENEANLLALSCLSEKELYRYLRGKKPHAWHITDLTVYDEPKELSKFMKLSGEYLKLAPQSWCYVQV